jgi:uncharacterized membrane protein YozB (DUF420 family)
VESAKRLAWVVILTLIVVIFVFAGIRFSQDVPAVVTDRMPPADSFERRYAENPAVAYAHIVPGIVFLAIAPFQVSRRFRNADFGRHRRWGRIALGAGLLTGVFAMVVGLLFPFGGAAEASASLVFGFYFLLALGLALFHIRQGTVDAHRRWMLRAFAIGIGVGSIRLVVGVSQVFGVAFEAIFGPAFWIAFVSHAIAAELWLRARPTSQT